MKTSTINLILIITLSLLLVLSCKNEKTGNNQNQSNNVKNTETNAAVNTPAPTNKPEAKKSANETKQVSNDIKWKDFDAVFGILSKTTDMQKESAWKNYEGKQVQWTGKVVEVSEGTFGGLKLNVKMNQATITYDVTVNLKDSEKSKASTLTKDKSVTFAGTLKSYGGAIVSTVIEDGEIR